MGSNGRGWACLVKRRARDRARYAANPAAENYARVRHALRARIAAKAARIEALEQHLEAQVRD